MRSFVRSFFFGKGGWFFFYTFGGKKHQIYRRHADFGGRILFSVWRAGPMNGQCHFGRPSAEKKTKQRASQWIWPPSVDCSWRDCPPLKKKSESSDSIQRNEILFIDAMFRCVSLSPSRNWIAMRTIVRRNRRHSWLSFWRKWPEIDDSFGRRRNCNLQEKKKKKTTETEPKQISVTHFHKRSFLLRLWASYQPSI